MNWMLPYRKNKRKINNSQNSVVTTVLGHFCFLAITLLVYSCQQTAPIEEEAKTELESEDKRIIELAEEYLQVSPVTITAYPAARSAGGPHDYYSEGRYWWPNPEDPDGPYIRKDGQSNPDNFQDHKRELRRFAEIVAALTAAYHLTNEQRYAQHAITHLKAWLVHPDTRMNPNLLYGQAIKGITEGRGIGIIDTLCLIEVARSVLLLAENGVLTGAPLTAIRNWFKDYAEWLNTHPHGIDERDNNNNHSTWWGAQLAAFARVAERDDLIAVSQEQFKKQLNIQLAANGSFPHELERTKPWHYTTYTLRAWTTFADLASTPEENLWNYQATNGKLQQAVEFTVPYLKTPASWPYATNLEPAAQAEREIFLLHAADALDRPAYRELWKTLPPKNDDNPAHAILWQQTSAK